MNSREKVRKMFRGELTDGMVIDFAGMNSTGIHSQAYNVLVKALGLPERPVRVYDVFLQTAYPEVDVIDKMGGDFMQVTRMRPRFGISLKQWKQGTLPDGTPCLYPGEFEPLTDASGNKDIYVNGVPFARMPANGLYYDQIVHPLEHVDSVEELERVYRPARWEDDEVQFVTERANELYETTDKSLVLGFGASIFEQAQRDFNYEQLFINLLTDPELMHAYSRITTDAYLYNLEQILPKVRGKVDVVQFFDDLGTQSALQIAPDTYREMIKPYHTELFAAVHRLAPDAKVLLHSCGAIFDIIPDLIESGVDLLNPVQISADGMDPQRLKDTYGKDIIFWGGGADMQQLVQSAPDVATVRRHVDKLARIFSPGGNVVFSQIHNIQPGVDIEKVTAIYDVARQYK